MDEKVLQKAVDDISTIKEVINRTGRSFAAFSKIFIYWGILFIFQGIIGIGMQINKEQVFELYTKFPILSYIFPVPIIAFIAAVIYYSVSRKLPLIGLEKHLMKVWLLILLLNVLPRRVNVIANAGVTGMNSITVVQNNLNILFFSLAIALIVTYLFTDFKRFLHLGFIFIAISLIDSYGNIPVDGNTLQQLLNAIALPFTFIFTGLYLKSKQVGGTPVGYKLNS